MEISKREPKEAIVEKLAEEWKADITKKIQETHTATLLYNQHHHDPRVEREKAVDIFLEKNKQLREEFVRATRSSKNEHMMAWLNHNANIPPLIYDEPSEVYTIDP